MIRMSTGLRASLIWDSGFRSLMWRGAIEIYSGNQPASADLAPTGTKLARITENGSPWTPGQSLGGLQTTEGPNTTSLVHDGNWVLKGLANGTPGWWRFVWNNGDNDLNSVFYPRLDGNVSESIVNLPQVITPATEISGIEFSFFILGN